MKSLIQQSLGEDWEKLPPVLQAHYRFATTTEQGFLDIDYPRFMQPVLSLLRCLGVLLNRKEQGVSTSVEKSMLGQRQYLRRSIVHNDGRQTRFDSFWIAAKDGSIIEFVNPLLGLQMQPYVVGKRLHYRGLRYLVKLGPLRLPIPECLMLGHASIVEEALDERHFAMDFRLVHPLFGQLFRYSGRFEVSAAALQLAD